MRNLNLLLALVLCAALAGCGDGCTNDSGPVACDSEPVIMTTSAGVDFVRTPDSCFDSLPGWPYAPQYVEIDGLRQAYVDEGPVDGPVVLLLHGQPSWSYLYRKMIPVLADAGFRVIAMDHLGMGRSDKPIDIASYSYLGHVDRLERFIQLLGLTDITLFCQDWGSLIGLQVAGLNPDWFARIAVGDGMLPVIPAGVQPYPTVENPDEIDNDLTTTFDDIPPQQPPFYDENCELLVPLEDYFFEWMTYAMTAGSFHASEVVEALTWFDLPPDEEAAYDAPFPSRIYMAGPRVFPSLVNDLPGVTEQAWEGLTSFTKPFVTIWAANDPGNLGQCSTQDNLICNIPGAEGQPHTRLPEASHFLQDDQGAEIAARLVDFMQNATPTSGDYDPTCGLPIAADGTGTSCTDDADCSALVADTCISDSGSTGFCSVEGCTAGSCLDTYVCCYDCNPIAAPFLPFDGSACFPPLLTSQLTGQAGCTCGGSTETPPVELTPDLCDDPNNMALLMDLLGSGNGSPFGETDEELVQRMIAAPTEGPFYMVNLIRFREWAEYPDGRETDLTGREADALYSPLEFLAAIGARIVFSADVDLQIDGDDIVWEQVAIVEYPCPLAFFAMITNPEFQARAIHKEAGVERTIAMVTELAPSPLPAGFVPPESPYPATEEDPAFELIHVKDFHEIAQYEEGVDEPVRTGREAWEIYSAGGAEASQRIGVYPTAQFVVQGVMTGDDRSWDEVDIVHMPSLAGFQALLDDETRQAGLYHRYAALAHNYSLITYPMILDIPDAPGSGEVQPLPVAADGTGTLCTDDTDCSALVADTCISDSGSAGFCSVEGCTAGSCLDTYVCCYDCNPATAPFLPFEGSACFSPEATSQLTGIAGCTCGGGVVDPTATSPPATPPAPVTAPVTATGTASPTIEPPPIAAIALVLPGISIAQEVGHELIDASAGFPLVVWGNQEITTPEYDALVLPPGWLRNQPREGVGQTGQFLRSPGLPADGEFTTQEMFGFTWLHQASVVALVGNLDPGGLLQASTVEKHHQLVWPAGSSITVLTSPEAVHYILVSRDAQRTSDTPTVPSGWTLEVMVLEQDLLIRLPLHTTVIRADNEDSFQGPVPANVLPVPVPVLPTSGLVVLTACLLSIGSVVVRMRLGASEEALPRVPAGL